MLLMILFFDKIFSFSESTGRGYFLFKRRWTKVENSDAFFAIIGLFAAIQHWYALFNEYGSITEIFHSCSKSL